VSQQELLRTVVTALETARLDYMITGSIASSLQGEPRATHDIDVVVVLRADDVDRIRDAFPPPRFYADRTSIAEAVRDRDMFKLEETEGLRGFGWVGKSGRGSALADAADFLRPPSL